MQFDITMPIFLFLLCFASIKIYKKFEDKLKQILEEKEFQIKDIIALVAAMGVMISIMVIVPSLALTVIILFGSPSAGLYEILELEGLNLDEIADFVVNTIPLQGVETVRTEEAVYASLAIFNLFISSDNQV